MLLTLLDVTLVLAPCAWIAWRYGGEPRALAAIVAAACLTIALRRSLAGRAVALLYLPPIAMYAAVMAGALDYAVMAAWVAAALVLQTLIIAGGGIHGRRARLAAGSRSPDYRSRFAMLGAVRWGKAE